MPPLRKVSASLPPSADETAGVGVDMETTVSDEYDRNSSKFTGKIDSVTITLK